MRRCRRCRLADNYTVSFEKYQQRSIDDDVFAIELVSADASTGIVTFSVTVANPESLTDGTTAVVVPLCEKRRVGFGNDRPLFGLLHSDRRNR